MRLQLADLNVYVMIFLCHNTFISPRVWQKQITVVKYQFYLSMTSRFWSFFLIKIWKWLGNWTQIKQIRVIFIHLKLWVAIARHNFKQVEI